MICQTTEPRRRGNELMETEREVTQGVPESYDLIPVLLYITINKWEKKDIVGMRHKDRQARNWFQTSLQAEMLY